MNNTLINPIEKASDIAEYMVQKYFEIKYPLHSIDEIELEGMIYEPDGNGDTRYTEEAQEIFNHFYDLVLTILEK